MNTKFVREMRALERIEQNRLLSEVEHLQRTGLMHIVDLALLQPEHANRWQAYERLKKMAKGIVGSDAADLDLQTDAHYQAMMDFIDWMLPTAKEEKDDTLYELQDVEEQEEVWV